MRESEVCRDIQSSMEKSKRKQKILANEKELEKQMNEIQSEWYFFILPFVTAPALLVSIGFYKFVIPRWFKFLEENNANHE